MENHSKNTDEKMDTILQTLNDSVGTQLHGMLNVQNKEHFVMLDELQEVGENRTKGICCTSCYSQAG